jgi:hypothetical protein
MRDEVFVAAPGVIDVLMDVYDWFRFTGGVRGRTAWEGKGQRGRASAGQELAAAHSVFAIARTVQRRE